MGETAGGEDGGGGQGARPGHQALQGMAQVSACVCSQTQPWGGGSKIWVSEETFCCVKHETSERVEAGELGQSNDGTCQRTYGQFVWEFVNDS